MLTKRQAQLLRFLESTPDDVSPSFEEMATAMDLHSKSGVHRIVCSLEERGYIRRIAHRARAIEVIRRSSGGSSWPVSPPEGSDPAPYEDMIRRIRALALANGAALAA